MTAERYGDRDDRVHRRRRLTGHRARLGDAASDALDLLDDARRQLDTLAADGFAAIPRDAVWPACAAFLAEVCIRLARCGRDAEMLYERARPPSAGLNLMVGMTICFGPADRLLGGLAALIGRCARSPTATSRAALALAERSRSPVWVGPRPARLGRAARRPGRAPAGRLARAPRPTTPATAFGMAAGAAAGSRRAAERSRSLPRHRAAAARPAACRAARWRCCASWPPADPTAEIGEPSCTSARTPPPTTCGPSSRRPGAANRAEAVACGSPPASRLTDRPPSSVLARFGAA